MIGIFGGTFDPIHFGHLRPAIDVLETLNLDQIRFIPCYSPVHRGQPNASVEQRCAMIEQAIQNQPKFVLDKIEIERGGPSYMVETLRELKAKYPETGLVLIMGIDAFAKFNSWKNPAEILQLANLAVTKRPSDSESNSYNQIWLQLEDDLKARFVEKLSEKFGQIIQVDVCQLDISSTKIREKILNNQQLDYLLPAEIINFIQQNKIYSPKENI